MSELWAFLESIVAERSEISRVNDAEKCFLKHWNQYDSLSPEGSSRGKIVKINP